MQRATRTPKIRVMMDSGAFSAWNSGKRINLSEYCNYLKANESWITDYVSLDVIGASNPEAAASQGYRNFQVMRHQGLNPIPVYHARENKKWLLRYLDAGCEYIGLSASSLVGKGRVDNWYTDAWKLLVNTNGRPIVKVHAFGEGRALTLLKYPWYSADTRSWLYAAEYNGRMRLGDRAHVNFRKDKRHRWTAQDVAQLPPPERKWFRKQLEEANIDWSFNIRNTHPSVEVRTYITCRYYLDLERRVNVAREESLNNPKKATSQGTPARYAFGSFFTEQSKAAGFKQLPFHLYLASGSNPLAQVISAHAQGRHTLFAYGIPFIMGHTQQLKQWAYSPLVTCRSIRTWLRYNNYLRSVLLTEEPP